MRMLRLSLATTVALLLASCASKQEEAPVTTPPPASVTEGLDRYMVQRARVEAVSFRLRKAAARDCAKQNATGPEIGLIVWSLANFENPLDIAYLKSKFALSDGVTVALAIDGSPAASAGLREGSVITHINDSAINEGKGATERFVARSNAAAQKGPLHLRLADGGEKTLVPENVCKFITLLVRSPETNAAADGRVLAITSGLFDLTTSDDELALVLGHELAHNVLGHLKKSSPARPGGILDAFMRATIGTAVAAAQSTPYSIAAEKEADYAGLYFMARAGYDFTAADAFWRRLNQTTRATQVIKTHPSGAERLKAIQSAIAEIKAKQKAGKPLEPNLKPRR
ncbi:MAG: M48 family metalloprotease [Micropepsaceae bacterium]